MISRREFCRRMALIAAGASAVPEQIDAFELLFQANTPQIPDMSGIYLIKEFSFGFAGRPRDEVLEVALLSNDQPVFELAINYRASFRWVVAPDTPVVEELDGLRWNVERAATDDPTSIGRSILGARRR